SSRKAARSGVSSSSIPPCGICQAGPGLSMRWPAKTSPEGLRTTSPTPRRYGREAMSSVAAAMSVRGTVEEGQPLQDVEGIGELVILGPARGDLLLALLLGLELLALVIREPVVLERTAQFALRPQR